MGTHAFAASVHIRKAHRLRGDALSAVDDDTRGLGMNGR